MISQDVELIYENCECVTIKADAVKAMRINTVSEELYYNPGCNVNDVMSEKHADDVWMEIDISDTSKIADKWPDEDPIRVLTQRRDICVIVFEGIHYHVNWYSPDCPYSPLMYTNAYQDPAKVKDGLVSIRIDARRKRPEYLKALWTGNDLYVQDCEASSTFTRKFRTTYGIMGSAWIAVSHIREHELETMCRIHYLHEYTELYPEDKKWYNKDIFFYDPSSQGNYVCFSGIEEGFWEQKTLPPEDGLAERHVIEKTDDLVMDAKFPVFRKAMFVSNANKVIEEHLAKEVSDMIYRETIQKIISTQRRSET